MHKKENWQHQLSTLITDPAVLLEKLCLDDSWLAPAKKAAQLFPLKVPESFLTRIEKGNPHDPLLLQVLPLAKELLTTTDFSPDPLGESKANPVPGLLHKYRGRVLVTLTSACAVHCRYCFRRSFPYEENNPGRKGWEAIFNYIRADASIHEVILSGGDPLSVSDALLKQFTDGLQTIPHVTRLRIHTRLPIMIPERITPGLIAWLASLPYKRVIVFHVNHPNEINNAVREGLVRLKPHAHLLNQTVLLKCVNDKADTLIKLSEALFDAGVLPYYLHVLDKVNGAAHFDLPTVLAIALHREMQASLPGYLVPKLTQEIAGQASKTLIY